MEAFYQARGMALGGGGGAIVEGVGAGEIENEKGRHFGIYHPRHDLFPSLPSFPPTPLAESPSHRHRHHHRNPHLLGDLPMGTFTAPEEDEEEEDVCYDAIGGESDFVDSVLASLGRAHAMHHAESTLFSDDWASGSALGAWVSVLVCGVEFRLPHAVVEAFDWSEAQLAELGTLSRTEWRVLLETLEASGTWGEVPETRSLLRRLVPVFGDRELELEKMYGYNQEFAWCPSRGQIRRAALEKLGLAGPSRPGPSQHESAAEKNVSNAPHNPQPSKVPLASAADPPRRLDALRAGFVLALVLARVLSSTSWASPTTQFVRLDSPGHL